MNYIIKLVSLFVQYLYYIKNIYKIKYYSVASVLPEVSPQDSVLPVVSTSLSGTAFILSAST